MYLFQSNSSMVYAALIVSAIVVVLIYNLLKNRSSKPELRTPLPKPASSSKVVSSTKPKSSAQQTQPEENYALSAEKMLKAGNLEKAMLTFEKGGFFNRAAEIAVQKKDLEKAAIYFEKAGELTKAATIYFDLKKYPKAETILAQLGKSKELGDIYKKRGELILAAKAYLNSSNFEEAANLLEGLGNHLEAADALNSAYEDAKQDMLGFGVDPYKPKVKQLGIKAATFFKKTGQNKRAAKLYFELQMHREAAESYVELREFQRAAEIFEMVGDLDQAEKYWKLAGDSSKAAKMEGEKLASDGQASKAIEKFEEVGDYARAAELYLEMQQPSKAGQMYEKAGEFSLAASFYRHAEEFENAARCFEHAGELRQAIECYERANLLDREISLRKQIGDYIGIAKKLNEQGMRNDALSFLSKIRSTDTRFKTAMSLKGKIHLALGESEKAEECFKQSIKAIDIVSGDDLDTIYHLSLLPQKANAKEDALRTLEDVLQRSTPDKNLLNKAQEIRKWIMEQNKEPTLHDSFTSSSPNLKKDERYVPIQEIGRGGMGVVYKARDKTLDRIVALKILPTSFKKNARAVNTFLREAKSAASLNHPNIVTIHDTGVQNGDYYIAMEYLDGYTLKEVLKAQKKLPYPQVLEILRQLLDALDYAHAKSVVHRDLTTNNIMWTKQKIIKIMDFGLAKVMKELLNEQSIIGGTPSFMSPEQTLGKPIDHRTDIYSLGICIFELLLGELPFQKGDLGYHHLHTPPPDPKTLDKNLPDIFSRIILKCMEKAPEKRFQSIEEIKALLQKQ